MRDDLGPDFESGEDARDHFPQGHFVGCGNCGFAVDISVPVLQHVDLVLSMISEVLADVEPRRVVEAIALTRGSMDETMRAKALDAHDHWELGQLHAAALRKARRGPSQPAKGETRRRRRS